MLIRSNNMKTTVVISEHQNLSEPSKGIKEARLFQHSYRYHLLMLVTLLGLLVGGILGSLTVGMTQVTHQSNVTVGLDWTVNISGEKTAHIFTAINNGTYFIHGTLQKTEKSEKCDDSVRLVWRRSTESKEYYKETKMISKNMKKQVAEIKAFNVRLDEKSKVHLKINCNYMQIKADFRVLYMPDY